MPRLLVAFLGFLIPVLGFVKLAVEVRERERPWLDAVVLSWLYGISSPFLTHFFIFITTIGDALLVAPTTVITGLYLLYVKRRRQATLLLFGVGGATLINLILKSIFQRPRPGIWQHLVEETGYSFPSGHAMASSALAFALILLFWQTRWRWWVLITVIVYVLLVGVSRLYLGVHYPSDIVGGWCISIAWVWIVKLIIDKFGTSAKNLVKVIINR